MTDIVELRRYTLRPGQRDVLIDLFDRELVETQEATGMRILGQFRDLGDPDQFVWVRSFPDLATRGTALPAFYTGPAWKANAAAANATMIDVDNVLLLRPAGRSGGIHVDPSVRDTPASSVVAATIYDLPAPVDDALVEFVEDTVFPVLTKAGGAPLGLLCTEYAENNFPALPIRTGVHKLVTFVSYRESAAVEQLADDRLPPAEQLLLTPTDRSLLR